MGDASDSHYALLETYGATFRRKVAAECQHEMFQRKIAEIAAAGYIKVSARDATKQSDTSTQHEVSSPISFINKGDGTVGPQMRMFASAQEWTASHKNKYPAYLARQHPTGTGYEYAHATWGAVFTTLLDPSCHARHSLHLYELIQQKLPCKLYFDIDANADLVPMQNTEDVIAFYARTVGFLTLVETLLAHLLRGPEGPLPETAAESGPRLRLQVVPLTANRVPTPGGAAGTPGARNDATDTDDGCTQTPGKLSIHYTASVQVGETHVMFANNQSLEQLSRVLLELATWVSDNRESFPTLQQCVWLDPDGRPSRENMMTDMGVYSKNRLFRMWTCQKVGTGRPLYRNRVLAHLLGPLQYTHKILSVGDNVFDETEAAFAQLVWRGTPPWKDQMWNAWMFEESLVTGYSHHTTVARWITVRYYPNKRKRSSDAQGTDDEAYAARVADLQLTAEVPPPPGLIQDIINDIERQIPGATCLHHIDSGGGPTCLTFSSRSKYCTIRGGFHTHNHVYYVCWLDTCTFYQRCFNQTCAASTDQGRSGVHRDTAEDRPDSNRTRPATITGRGPSFKLSPHLYDQVGAHLKANGLAFFNIFSEDSQAYAARQLHVLNQPAPKRASQILDETASMSLQMFEDELLRHFDELVNGPDQGADGDDDSVDTTPGS